MLVEVFTVGWVGDYFLEGFHYGFIVGLSMSSTDVVRAVSWKGLFDH